MDRRDGFTLVEILTSVAVFAVISLLVGNIFLSLEDAWKRQRQAADLAANARWAADFLAREIQASDSAVLFTVPVEGLRLQLQLDADPAPEAVCYWRGDGNDDALVYGDASFLYRAQAPSVSSGFPQRQQLANYLVDNPVDPATGAAYPVFSVSGSLVTVRLTFRSDPASPAGPRNRELSVCTQARLRN